MTTGPVWILGALLLAAGLLGAMTLVLKRRVHWLIAGLLIALGYIAFEVVPRAGPPPAWAPAVRWGLFLATLGALLRFRFCDRFGRRSAESAEVADGLGQRPDEEQR